MDCESDVRIHAWMFLGRRGGRKFFRCLGWLTTRCPGEGYPMLVRVGVGGLDGRIICRSVLAAFCFICLQLLYRQFESTSMRRGEVF